jgi:hypothetical protein
VLRVLTMTGLLDLFDGHPYISPTQPDASA